MILQFGEGEEEEEEERGEGGMEGGRQGGRGGGERGDNTLSFLNRLVTSEKGFFFNFMMTSAGSHNKFLFTLRDSC